jgi:trans-aconitate methyltransferase
MKREDREAIVKLYEGRYTKLGNDVRTLGWRSREDQRLRFQVLSDIADLTGASICDIGCGFGDLVPYLRERFRDFRYTGVDLSPSLVAEARRLHSGYEFHCLDILDADFNLRADYFLLSGALNLRVGDNWALTEAMLSRMFELADRAVAVNFLTNYVTFERAHNYHHSPERVFAFARSLTNRVALRHDYPLWEFTIYLYGETERA